MANSAPRETLRFGDLDLDITAYELRREGRRVRLERQPMDLLILLVERRGQLVSRDEIIDLLWGKDVFVDVETGIHTAIRKIRQALRDAPDSPVFIETVPGKGYRFIAPVEIVPQVPSAPLAADVATERTDAAAAQVDLPPTAPRLRSWPRPVTMAWGLVALAALTGVLLAWRSHGADASPPRVRLAVMPFENLSGDAGRQYLADGLAEETIVWLGRADPERLAVVGSPSMMSFRQTHKTIAEVSEELQADFLVEGTIRTEPGRLRVTVKLIRARDQEQIWSDVYERNAESVLTVQQELSASIARQIQMRVSPDRGRALARRQTRSADAYDLFLRATTFAHQRTPATTERAIEYFERAIAVDSSYALAWSGLAMAHGASPINSDVRAGDAWKPAARAADQAVSLDPGLAEAQFALGYVNWMFEWDWRAAETAFRRALTLDPSLTMAHVSLGHVLSQMGRHEAARDELRIARELDPLFAMTHALSSQVAFQAGDYGAAIGHARRAIALDEEFWIGYMMLGQSLERLGQSNEALAALATASRLSRQNSKPVALTGYALARVGRTAEAREVLAALGAASRQRYIPPYAIALVHAGLGESADAFAWLDRAYAARDIHLMYLVADTKWDRYRDDPRFTEIVRRCNFSGPRARD